jgi:DNA-binding PadR family transcriptional regulator
MPKKAFENLTESMFYVLMAFSGGSKCGIEVVEYVEHKTRGRVRIGPATLYTLLGKFEKEKYIEEIEVDGRKRTYQITNAGLRAYQEETARLKCCVEDAESEGEFKHDTETK